MMDTPEDDKLKQETKSLDVLKEKLVDAETPGFQAEIDPDEAEKLGAFVEDALSEADALDSTGDMVTGDMVTGDQQS
jgi:hypothetical protein